MRRTLPLYALAGGLAGAALVPRELPPVGTVPCHPESVDPGPYGASYAARRCGHLELADSLGMRLGVDLNKRVVAVGDSFTFGYGVSEGRSLLRARVEDRLALG